MTIIVATDGLRNIEKQNLEEMIVRSDKVRFEIKDDKICALYGHPSSFIPFTKIQKIASKPPHILYHGISPSAVKNIMSGGLRLMNRHYVHLSTDKHTALQVGNRKIISKTKKNNNHSLLSEDKSVNTSQKFMGAVVAAEETVEIQESVVIQV